MARKLSKITRCVVRIAAVALTLLAADKARAEEPAPASTRSVIVPNPFVSRSVQSTTIAQQSPPAQHEQASYQNPFAGRRNPPPIQIPLLAGPISRWQRADSPLDEPSSIKAAILSAEPTELRGANNRAGDFANPPDPARFDVNAIVQPAWLLESARTPASPIDQAAFNQRIGNDREESWASGPPQAVRREADFSPLVVTDIPDSPDAWLAQAERAAKTADSLDELSSVARLCQRGLAGKPTAELSRSLRQLAAWAHNRRGEQLADADRQQEAIDEFQTAIALDANCALAIHNRAVTLAQQNRPEAALRDFNRVIDLNPGLAIAYRNRAELLASLGRTEEALADYDRAIESYSDDPGLLAARAYAWQQIGQFDRARDDLNRAIEVAPNRSEALAQRGNLSADGGHYGSALADFQLAIANDPHCAEAYRSMAWLHATCPDEQYRDAKQALAAARKATELSPPDDYLVLAASAAALAAAGQFNDAVQLQQQAIAAAPPLSAEPLRQRLSLYQAGHPFHSERPANARRAAAQPSH